MLFGNPSHHSVCPRTVSHSPRSPATTLAAGDAAFEAKDLGANCDSLASAGVSTARAVQTVRESCR
eukprot:1886728-Prymnesium_polylepis.1